MVERAWGHRCAITGTGVRQVLQAAHLRPYSETRDNRAENGILLRMDLHALWDEHLLGIDPVTQRVRLAACLAKTGYKALEGKPLRTRTDGLHLDAHGLQMRWERFLKCAGGVRED